MSTQDNPAKDLNIMCDLIWDLFTRSDRLWRAGLDLSRQKLSKTAIDNHQTMIDLRRPIEEGTLKKLLKERAERKTLKLILGQESPYLHLPPLDVEQEFTPLLSISCDLGESPPDVRLCIMMCRIKNRQLYGDHVFGFRFERHKPEKESKADSKPSLRHDYWHAQVTIWSLSEAEDPPWIPVQIPCILAKAENPVTLFLYTMISLYGKGVYNRIFSDRNIDGKYWLPIRDILFDVKDPRQCPPQH